MRIIIGGVLTIGVALVTFIAGVEVAMMGYNQEHDLILYWGASVLFVVAVLTVIGGYLGLVPKPLSFKKVE